MHFIILSVCIWDLFFILSFTGGCRPHRLQPAWLWESASASGPNPYYIWYIATNYSLGWKHVRLLSWCCCAISCQSISYCSFFATVTAVCHGILILWCKLSTHGSNLHPLTQYYGWVWCDTMLPMLWHVLPYSHIPKRTRTCHACNGPHPKSLSACGRCKYGVWWRDQECDLVCLMLFFRSWAQVSTVCWSLCAAQLWSRWSLCISSGYASPGRTMAVCYYSCMYCRRYVSSCNWFLIMGLS